MQKLSNILQINVEIHLETIGEPAKNPDIRYLHIPTNPEYLNGFRNQHNNHSMYV